MEFARNPVNLGESNDLLAAAHAHRTAPLWLLVDAALVDEKRLQSLAASLNWDVSNVLQGSPLEPYGAHAPQLLALPMHIEPAKLGVLRLMALNPQAPAFSVIESAASPAELSRLCAYLAQVTIDDDLLVHCRFADVRVLSQLSRTLSPSQLLRVSTCIDAWYWQDHLCTVQRWPPAVESTAMAQADASQHLSMDKMQFAAMLDASEPDTVFLLLLENTPELVPHTNRGQFRDRISYLLARADLRHLTSPNDRFQFAVLGLSCGDDFDEHPGLQATWSAIERGQTLVEAMKDWSETLWDQLQSGKTSVAA